MLSQELTHGSSTSHHVKHACARTHVAFTSYKPYFVVTKSVCDFCKNSKNSQKLAYFFANLILLLKIWIEKDGGLIKICFMVRVLYCIEPECVWPRKFNKKFAHSHILILASKPMESKKNSRKTCAATLSRISFILISNFQSLCTTNQIKSLHPVEHGIF